MVQIAHLGPEHVKVRRIREEHVKSQENSGGYLRSGDDLKKLENSSSRRKVHMYVVTLYYQSYGQQED